MLSLQPILGISTQLSKISPALIDPGRLLLSRSNNYPSLQINSIEPLGQYSPLIQRAKFLTDRQERSKIGWDNWQPGDLEDRFTEVESERFESNTIQVDNDSIDLESDFDSLDIFTQILDDPSEYNLLAEDDFTIINDIEPPIVNRQTRSKPSPSIPIGSQKNLPKVDVDRDLAQAESIVTKPIVPDRVRSSKPNKSKQNIDNISRSTQVGSIESDVSDPDIFTHRSTNLGAEEISTPTIADRSRSYSINSSDDLPTIFREPTEEIEDRSISSLINSSDDLPTIFREPSEDGEIFTDIFMSELSTDLVNTEPSRSNSPQLPQVESIITNKIEQPPTIFRDTNYRQEIFSDILTPEIPANLINPKPSNDNLPRLPQTDGVLSPTNLSDNEIKNSPPIVLEPNTITRESIDPSAIELLANLPPTEIIASQGDREDIQPNSIDHSQTIFREATSEEERIIDVFIPELTVNQINPKLSIDPPLQLSPNRSIEPEYPPTIVNQIDDLAVEFTGVDPEPSVNIVSTTNSPEIANKLPSNLVDSGSLDGSDDLSTIFHENSLIGEELFPSNTTDSSAKLVSPKISEDLSVPSAAQNLAEPDYIGNSIDLTTQFSDVETEPFKNLSVTEINTEITKEIFLKSFQPNPIFSTTQFTSDIAETATEYRELSNNEAEFTDISIERLQTQFNPEIEIDNLAENSFTTDIDRVPSIVSEVSKSESKFPDILPNRSANFDRHKPNTDPQLASAETDSTIAELTNINELDNTPTSFRQLDERGEIFTDSEIAPSARLVRSETTETEPHSSPHDLDLDRSSPIFRALSDTGERFTNVGEEPELLARSIDAEIAIDNEPQLAQIDSMLSQGAHSHNREDSPAIGSEASLETNVRADVSILEQPTNLAFLAPSDSHPPSTEETTVISSLANANPNEVEHPPTIFRAASVESDGFVDTIAPAFPTNLTPEVNINEGEHPPTIFRAASIESDGFVEAMAPALPANVIPEVNISEVTEILPSVTEPDTVEHPLPVKGYATGGKVTTDRGLNETIHPSDTVAAMLAPDEFVVNVRDAQKNLNLLEHINSGREAREFITPTLAPDISPAPIPQEPSEPISTKVESLPTQSLQLKSIDSLISPSLDREIEARKMPVFNDSSLNTFTEEQSERGKQSVNYDSPSLIFRKPQSTASIERHPPMQWNTVEDLLNGHSEPQTIFNFTDRSESVGNNFGNESTPPPQIFAKHSPLVSNIDRREPSIDRVTTTDALPITETINNSSVQTEAGNNNTDDLENLAREVYYRLRQRLEIERERQGVTHGRIAW